MNGCAVRQWSPEDLEGVLTVEQESFSDPWTRGMFCDELKNAHAWYLVAETGGEIAGYAGLWFVADEGHITNIAVRPSFRRRGIGATLLSALLSECRGRALALATLEVRAGNQPAQELYRAFGFREVGRRRGYYQDNHEDAILMTRFFLETDQ